MHKLYTQAYLIFLILQAIESNKTRVVPYTCRYSSGPLIPNLATATDWNIGINCPQEYLQV